MYETIIFLNTALNKFVMMSNIYKYYYTVTINHPKSNGLLYIFMVGLEAIYNIMTLVL